MSCSSKKQAVVSIYYYVTNDPNTLHKAINVIYIYMNIYIYRYKC